MLSLPYSLSLKKLSRSLFLLSSLLLLLSQNTLANQPTGDFSSWLELLRKDALNAGVSTKTLNTALATLEAPEPKVIESYHKQPERKATLQDYVRNRVTPLRLDEGRVMMRRYATVLERIEKQYRVQKRFLVALWGIESSYGRAAGQRPVIQSLATLAYKKRRTHYFRKELIEALKILDAGHVTLDELKGSWAGAMGPFQFMPTSYTHYAVDGDGDGRIDIWSSVPDALASAANYLKMARWKYDQTWGRPVQLPDHFDKSLSGLKKRRPLSRWQELGVRRSNGAALPQRNLQSALIIPDGPAGPAYLVYANFKALRRWNKSNSFAVTVGTLADRF
ncbi:MAG: lytic murein transglycosylase [Desulfuromonas sp.]|nr:MAG: lytic murein transglycosylase [Desulfuromonas sp.]